MDGRTLLTRVGLLLALATGPTPRPPASPAAWDGSLAAGPVLESSPAALLAAGSTLITGCCCDGRLGPLAPGAACSQTTLLRQLDGGPARPSPRSAAPSPPPSLAALRLMASISMQHRRSFRAATITSCTTSPSTGGLVVTGLSEGARRLPRPRLLPPPPPPPAHPGPRLHSPSGVPWRAHRGSSFLSSAVWTAEVSHPHGGLCGRRRGRQRWRQLWRAGAWEGAYESR